MLRRENGKTPGWMIALSILAFTGGSFIALSTETKELAASLPQRVHSDGDTIKAFEERVARYGELQNEVKGKIPSLRDNDGAVQIAAHQQALALGIRAARTNASEGDVFFDGARDQLIRIVRNELQRPEGANLRATIELDEPGDERLLLGLSVNASYPEGVPLSTMPASLLTKLPQLPKDMEYRFVGKDLVLRDVSANLFVDFVRDVIP
jgi:hypothetical protein